MSERTEKASLRDKIEAAERARHYCQGMSYEEFLRDESTQERCRSEHRGSGRSRK